MPMASPPVLPDGLGPTLQRLHIVGQGICVMEDGWQQAASAPAAAAAGFLSAPAASAPGAQEGWGSRAVGEVAAAAAGAGGEGMGGAEPRAAGHQGAGTRSSGSGSSGAGSGSRHGTSSGSHAAGMARGVVSQWVPGYGGGRQASLWEAVVRHHVQPLLETLPALQLLTFSHVWVTSDPSLRDLELLSHRQGAGAMPLAAGSDLTSSSATLGWGGQRLMSLGLHDELGGTAWWDAVQQQRCVAFVRRM